MIKRFPLKPLLLPTANSLICLLMSLGIQLRALAYTLLALYCCVGLLYVASKCEQRKFTISKQLFFTLSILVLFIFKDLYFVIFKSLNVAGLIYTIFTLIYFISVYASIRTENHTKYMLIWSSLIYVAGLTLATSIAIGVPIEIQPNYPAALMAPLAILLIYYRGKHWGSISLILLAFLVSILTEARASTALILFAFTFTNLSRISERLCRAAFITVFFIFLTGQYYLTLENSTISNELLTYRPVIWNFYYNQALSSPLFGLGTSEAALAEGAASAYGEFAQRGVNGAYGTQSMYIKYFTEAGLLGLIGVISLFIYLSLSKISIGWVFFASYAMLSFPKAIKLDSLQSTACLLR